MAQSIRWAATVKQEKRWLALQSLYVQVRYVQEWVSPLAVEEMYKITPNPKFKCCVKCVCVHVTTVMVWYIHQADRHGLMYSAPCGLRCSTSFPEQTNEYEFLFGYVPLLHSLTPLLPRFLPSFPPSLHLLTGVAVQSSHANIPGGGWAVDVANLGT